MKLLLLSLVASLFIQASNDQQNLKKHFIINFNTFAPQEDKSCFSPSGKPNDQWGGKPRLYLIKPFEEESLLFKRKSKEEPIAKLKFEALENGEIKIKDFTPCPSNNFSTTIEQEGRELIVKCSGGKNFLKIVTKGKNLISKITLGVNGKTVVGNFYPETKGTYVSSCGL